MKKIILIATILLGIITNVKAQVLSKSYAKRIGAVIKEGYQDVKETIIQDTKPSGEHTVWDIYIEPKIGFNVSQAIGVQNRPKLGINAGINTEVFFTKKLAFDIELQYSYQGLSGLHNQNNNLKTDGPYNLNIHYLNTNYLMRWYPWADLPWSFTTGLHTGYLISAKAKNENGESLNIRNNIYKSDIALPIGISYEWKQWQVEARYNLSFKKLSKNSEEKDLLRNAHNSMLEVTLGYRIQIL
ncbi:porin family protein [Prevotella sp.]